MMPTGTKAACAGEVAWGNESSNYDASLEFSRDCMDGSDLTDKTPTEEGKATVAPTFEGDSDDDDSIVIEA